MAKFATAGLLLIVFIGCNKKDDGQRVDTTSPAQLTKADTTPQATMPFDSAKVSVQNLPATVGPYVEKNYPGYKIASAAYDPLCGGAPAIDVSIRYAGHPTYSLIFKPDGNYVQKEEDILIHLAPANVMTTVKEQYPGFNAGKEIEKITLADGTLEYSFDLTKGRVQKEVIFTSDGAVVCDGKE